MKNHQILKEQIGISYDTLHATRIDQAANFRSPHQTSFLCSTTLVRHLVDYTQNPNKNKFTNVLLHQRLQTVLTYVSELNPRQLKVFRPFCVY